MKSTRSKITVEKVFNKLINCSRNYEPTKKEFALINKSPRLIFYYSKLKQKPYEKGEKILCKNAQYSYYYLESYYHIIKKFPNRLKLLEKTISKNSDYAYNYAADYLENRFELGEESIAKNADNSYGYAREVIKKRFELGENSISKDAYLSLEYATYVIKGKFPKGEKAIKKQYLWEEYVENMAMISLDLAKEKNERIKNKKIEKDVICNFKPEYTKFIKKLVSENINDGQKIIEDYSDYEFFDDIILSISKNQHIPDEVHNYMIAKGIISGKQCKNYLKNKEVFSKKIKNFLLNHKGKTVDELLCCL